MEPCTLKAVGVWFLAMSTRRYLYLLRSDQKNPEVWGLPGGKLNQNETLLGGMERECCEELGFFPTYKKLIPLEKFTANDNYFEYHTWVCIIDEEFTPRLNHEHIGYAWIDAGIFPKPMHPGLWSTVNIDAIKQKLHSVEGKEFF